MKNITRYISENAETNLTDFIKLKLNGDFEQALQILQRQTSYKDIAEFIENYNAKTSEEIKGSIPGKLITLFENNNFNPADKKNKRLLKSIYKNFNLSDINLFADTRIDFKENLLNSNSDNIFKIIMETANNSSENFKELLNYIFEYTDFTKFGGNNGKAGECELLLQLITNKGKINSTKDGDIVLNNGDTVEVKCTRSKASLGASKYNIEEVSKQFLDAIWSFFSRNKFIKNKLIDSYEKNLVTLNGKTYKRCIGGKQSHEYIQNILNTKDTFKFTASDCNTIFKIYIGVLLNQYKDSDYIEEDIFNALKGINPFSLDNDNQLKVANLTNITAFIHLLAYQASEGFKYLFVCEDTGKYVILDFSEFIYNGNINDKILKMFEMFTNKLKILPPESRADLTAGREAVSKISGLK